MTSQLIKRVGGKAHLLPLIHDNLPRKWSRLVEPFLGGGVIFSSFNAQRRNKALVNDADPHLIAVFEQVRDDPHALWRQLTMCEVSLTKYMYWRGLDVSKLTKLGIATRAWYLTYAAWNGLFRVNSDGGHNVPFGGDRRKVRVDIDHLLEWQQLLKKVELTCHDFECVVDATSKGDFIVLDPPYVGQFSGYCKGGFGMDNHVRLAKSLNRATTRGVHWMAFNSPDARDLYEDLDEAEVKVIDSRTLIDRPYGNSGSKEELLIVNY